MGDTLVEQKMMGCPICDKFTIIDTRKRIACVKCNGEIYSSPEIYYKCRHCGGEFVSGKMMNENLRNAKQIIRGREET